MDIANFRQYLSILTSITTFIRRQPLIKTAPTDFQYTAHFLDTMNGTVLLNKLVLHWDFLEKMAKAFFKMSRSSSNSRFSRRNRFNSNSVSLRLWCPLPGNALPLFV